MMHALVAAVVALALSAGVARAGCPEPDAFDLDKLATPGEGAAIESVTVHGAGIEGATLDPPLGTVAGGTYDAGQLRADLRALWASGRASQIVATAHPGAVGYAVDIALTAPPRVARVEIDGVPRADVRLLAVLDGTLLDGARLARLTAAEATWLATRGYLHARLTSTARVTCEGGNAVAIVHVTGALGRRYTISHIAIHGSAVPWPRAQIAEIGGVNAAGGYYDAGEFAQQGYRLGEAHRAAGYLDATSPPPDVVISERDATVAIDVYAVAGARYRGGDVACEGPALACAAVTGELHGWRGAWYSAADETAAKQRVGARLLALGMHVGAWDTRRVPATHALDLHVTVEAGP